MLRSKPLLIFLVIGLLILAGGVWLRPGGPAASQAKAGEEETLKTVIAYLKMRLANMESRSDSDPEELKALRLQIARLEADAAAGPGAGAIQPSVPAAARPAPRLTSPVQSSWTEDATRQFYNGALRLPWSRGLGDWYDAEGVLGGPAPLAREPAPTAPGRYEIDVTDAVRRFGADFYIRGRLATLASREAVTGRPVLLLRRQGQERALIATADVTMNPSTIKSLGGDAGLEMANGFFIRFDQRADVTIDKALLRLEVTKIWSGPPTPTEVFRAGPAILLPASPVAADGTNGDVVLHLKGRRWLEAAMGAPDARRINGDGSLTVAVPTGDATAVAAIYSIPESRRREVMFARTIMKAHDDFDPVIGGKLPGLANTGMGDKAPSAERAGWGARVANGTRWSARTNRFGSQGKNASTASFLALGPYAYRVNRASFNGEGPSFSLPAPRGQVFVLDQMVKLNSIAPDGTPTADGAVAYWLNGKPVLYWDGIIWRTSASQKTLPSEYWLDVYVGGTGYRAPYPHHITFYEAIVSTKLLPFDRGAVARLNN